MKVRHKNMRFGPTGWASRIYKQIDGYKLMQLTTVKKVVGLTDGEFVIWEDSINPMQINKILREF